MRYTFDFVKMELLLHNFQNICNVRFSLVNINNEIVCHSKEHSSFCVRVCSTEEGLARCKKCDKKAFDYISSHRLEYYDYICHAGIHETIIPIWFQETMIACIYIGQYLRPANLDKQWKNCLELLKPWYPDPENLEQDFLQLERMDTVTTLSSCKILIACSRYICAECVIPNESDPDLQLITEYIDLHYHQKITLSDIANALSMSRTSICNIAARNDTTINTMIRNRRLSIAKELLRTTYYPVAEVSDLVGIPDYNYFTKQFKAKYNYTPSEYRTKKISD